MSQSTLTPWQVPRVEPPPDFCPATLAQSAGDHQVDPISSPDFSRVDGKPATHAALAKYFRPFRSLSFNSRQHDSRPFMLGETRMHDATTVVKPRRHFGAFVWLLFLGSFFGVLNVKSAHAQTFTLSPTAQTVVEGSSTTFTITLTGGTNGTVYTVIFRTASPPVGTATADKDYPTFSRVVAITSNGGTATSTEIVDTFDDQAFENSETFNVQLASGGSNPGIVGSPNTATITIADNDPRPTISVPSKGFVEGNTNSTANVTVRLSARNDAETVTFKYSFGSGLGADPATKGTDFDGVDGMASFMPGETTKTIPFTLIGDTFDERDENFVFTVFEVTNVSNPAGAQGTLTIFDDDAPDVSISDASIIEPDNGQTAQAVFRVDLSTSSVQDVTIRYTVDPISSPPDNDPAEEVFVANRLRDYVDQTNNSTTDPNNGSISRTFPAGTTSLNISVPIDGDLVDEANETFQVLLFAGANQLGTIRFLNTAGQPDNQGIGTIIDNDRPTFRLGAPLSVAEPIGGQTTLNFPVTLDQPSERLLTITVSTQDGTATAGPLGTGDYISKSETLTFQPGVAGDSTQPAVQRRVFQVVVNSDTIDEIDESFFVNLSNANVADALFAVGQTTGTIIDDDGPQISIADVTANEGNSGTTPFRFTVTLSAPSPQPITVNFRTQDGSATSSGVNPDFQTQSGTLTFVPSTTTQTITINVIGDRTYENLGAAETFTVILSNATNADPTTPFTKNVGTGSIESNNTTDDPVPTISVNNLQLAEGALAPFTISLSNPADREIKVSFTTSDGTASDGTTRPPADYMRTTGTVTFSPANASAPAETSKIVNVATISDTVDEADETFFLTLTVVSGPATAPAAPGTATIIDDDGPNVSVSNAPAVLEGNSGTTLATFTVTLSAPSPEPITLNYSTANGTATAPSDFTSTTGTVDFTPGQTLKTITVPVVGDTLEEPDETFTLNVTNPNTLRATLTNATATGTIIDDDTPKPDISINNVTLTEGNSGSVNALFTVRLSRAFNRAAVTVDFATADGTAVAGSDYTATSGRLTFAPGELTQTIPVAVLGDTLEEANETFTVVLSNASNGTLAPGTSGTGTITDDDAATLTLTLSRDTVPEGGTVGALVTRSANLSQDLVVTLSTSDATEATVPSQVTIPAGATSAEFTITAPVEEAIDGSQTVTISASADRFIAANARLTVTDVIPARLTLTINPDLINEMGSANAATATITRNMGFETALTVTLTNSNPRRVTAPESVIIPAGSSSAVFIVRALNDLTAMGTQAVIITATAPNFASSTAAVSVRDDDVAGITVTPISGLRTTEEGGTATFKIKLTSRPTSDVTIGLQSGSPGEARLAITSITIKPEQFASERIVTVTGVNDGVADGDREFIIITKPARSLDPAYNGRNPADVKGINADNEVPGFNVTPLTLRTTEASGSRSQQSFTISLKASPVPGTSVYIGLSSSDLTEGRVSPQSLRFTSANFNRPQTVTVTGVDDFVADGNVSYTIITSAAKAPGSPYNGLNPADVTVTNEDNDDNTVPRVVITSPEANASVQSIIVFTGTATDPGPAFVARVSGVLFRTMADGRREFFNANGVASTTQQLLTATGTERFRFLLSLPPGRSLPSGRYTLQVTAVDTASNAGRSSVDFTVNNQAPVLAITSPRNNTRVRSAETISGTVKPAGALGSISNVSVVIRKGTTVVRRLTAIVTGERFTSANTGNLADGSYTAEVTAKDSAGNIATATTSFTLDSSAPTGVAITSPINGAEVSNIRVITGTAGDVGTGLDRVELVIRRRSDDTYFNGRAFVKRGTGTDGQPAAEPTVRATLSGNTFSYTLPSGLPADPDPLNAFYSITAVAYDTADNMTASSQVTVRLNPNASTGGGTVTPGTSNVRLSSVSVKASDASIVLAFTGNLDGDVARDASLYNVTVNGQRVAVESVSFRAVNGVVVLTLRQGSIRIGDAVSVSFTDLRDASGLIVAGQATATTR